MFKREILENKVIMVTGGGTGLGLAMARRMAELGAHMVIVSRRQEHLEAARAELSRVGKEPWLHPLDVRDSEAVASVIDAVVADLGRIDVLVNNAAGNFLCPTADLTPKGFQVVIDIVLRGTFNCSLYCGRQMIERGEGGVILNILAPYIVTGSPYVVPSACAKAGVAALTRSLAVEWGKHGIRVNGIVPGPFPTEGAWSRLIPDERVEAEMVKRIPLGRFGRHEELANLAVFLVSDLAAYITGEFVFIDGGQWLRQGAMFADLEGFEAEMRKLRKFRQRSPRSTVGGADE